MQAQWFTRPFKHNAGIKDIKLPLGDKVHKVLFPLYMYGLQRSIHIVKYSNESHHHSCSRELLPLFVGGWPSLLKTELMNFNQALNSDSSHCARTKRKSSQVRLAEGKRKKQGVI